MTEPSFSIRPICYPDDLEAVLALWESAGPGVHIGYSDTPGEIARKLERDPDLFLVAEVDRRLVGSVIGGYDGRRGLIYHLAVDTTLRQQGIGSALMNEVERRLREKGCYKAYLLVVKENSKVIDFYQRCGWDSMDVSILGKELGINGNRTQEPC